MTTVLYNQESICQTLGLAVSQLPLLACILGNDIVSKERMHHIRSNAMAAYRYLPRTCQMYSVFQQWIFISHEKMAFENVTQRKVSCCNFDLFSTPSLEAIHILVIPKVIM